MDFTEDNRSNKVTQGRRLKWKAASDKSEDKEWVINVHNAIFPSDLLSLIICPYLRVFSLGVIPVTSDIER